MWACSHVCMQRHGWILFFHYFSIMILEMGIFICILKKKKKAPLNLLLSSLACKLPVSVTGEGVFFSFHLKLLSY